MSCPDPVNYDRVLVDGNGVLWPVSVAKNLGAGMAVLRVDQGQNQDPPTYSWVIACSREDGVWEIRTQL